MTTLTPHQLSKADWLARGLGIPRSTIIRALITAALNDDALIQQVRTKLKP